MKVLQRQSRRGFALVDVGVGAIQGSLRDRLAALSRGEIIGLLLVVGVTLIGGALWYVRSLPQPVEIRAAVRPSASPVSSSTAVIVVDVAGWVHRPGVYEFVEGDRVIDALEAAGGPRKGAQTTALNLASPLVDAQQIVVPAPSRGPTASSQGGVDASGKVNVNSADATQLESLSGIGEVLAQAIIDHREDNGPFKSVDELMDVSGIGEATLEEIRDRVTV